MAVRSFRSSKAGYPIKATRLPTAASLSASARGVGRFCPVIRSRATSGAVASARYGISTTSNDFASPGRLLTSSLKSMDAPYRTRNGSRMKTPRPSTVRLATSPATCRFVATIRSGPDCPITQPVPPHPMRKLTNSMRPTEGISFSVPLMRASVPGGKSSRLSPTPVPSTTASFLISSGGRPTRCTIASSAAGVVVASSAPVPAAADGMLDAPIRSSSPLSISRWTAAARPGDFARRCWAASKPSVMSIASLRFDPTR